MLRFAVLVLLLLPFLPTVSAAVMAPYGIFFAESVESYSEPAANPSAKLAPSIYTIKVDTAWHAKYSEYIDAKGAQFNDGNFINFRFRLQGIFAGSRMIVSLQNENGQTMLCAHDFTKDWQTPFQLKMKCGIDAVKKLNGNYRVFISIFSPEELKKRIPKPTASRFWGFSDESYFIAINPGANIYQKPIGPQIPPEKPSTAIDSASIDLFVRTLAPNYDALGKPMLDADGNPSLKEITFNIDSKYVYLDTLQTVPISSGLEKAKEIKKPDTIAIPKPLDDSDFIVTEVALKLMGPAKDTICEGKTAPPQKIPSKDSAAVLPRPIVQESIKCVDSQTNKQEYVVEVTPDTSKKQLQFKIDSIETKPAQSINGLPPVEFEDPELIFSPTERTAILRVASDEKHEPLVKINSDSDGAECFKIGKREFDDDFSYGFNFFKPDYWDVEITFDPICEFKGKSNAIEVEIVGKKSKNSPLAAVNFAPDILFITTKKLLVDQKLKDSLRKYVQFQADSFQRHAKFITLNGKYGNERLGLRPNDMSNPKALMDRILYLFGSASYVIILGGEDVFPMGEIKAYSRDESAILTDKAYGSKVYRFPTPKGDTSSELVVAAFENALGSARKKRGELRVIGDGVCQDSKCPLFETAKTFVAKFKEADLKTPQIAGECKPPECLQAPPYCLRKDGEKTGTPSVCSKAEELKSAIKTSDILIFLTNGGGGTNFNVLSNDGKLIAILTAKEASEIKLENNPIVFILGDGAGSIGKINKDGSWNKMDGKDATIDNMIMFNLIKNGASAVIASTSESSPKGNDLNKWLVSTFANALGRSDNVGRAFEIAKSDVGIPVRDEFLNSFQLYGDPYSRLKG
ncbi:hypothetical protein HY989_03835 [Candidatus Micrarchaeota archaeon]|nr:hypothetical protein [Candidatus Micrarchaeota archaeon]